MKLLLSIAFLIGALQHVKARALDEELLGGSMRGLSEEGELLGSSRGLSEEGELLGSSRGLSEDGQDISFGGI